jgi:hypothetical protein
LILDVNKAIDDLVSIYYQIAAQQELEKDIKTSLKEAGLNAAVIASVAKAKAAGNLDALREKSELILEISSL